MPYTKTLEEGLKEFDKRINEEGDFTAGCYECGETIVREEIKSFLTTFAEKIRESVVGEVRDDIKKLSSNRFSGMYGEFARGGYDTAVNDLLAKIKNK